MTLVLIFALLFMKYEVVLQDVARDAAVPFSAVGAIALFHLLGYNVSIAAGAA